MYRIYKPQGSNVNITINNTDTYASVQIGKQSLGVAMYLRDHGHTIDNTSDEWDFEITKEVATELCNKALKMKKPIRDQRKKVIVESEQVKNKMIDAMDVILGLATYSK